MKTIERKILVGFICASTILLLFFGITYRNMHLLITHKVNDSYSLDVLRLSEEIFKDAVDIETATRGYIITADSGYLQPYNSAIRDLEKELNELILITRNDSSTVQRAVRLKELIAHISFEAQVMIDEEAHLRTDSLERLQRLQRTKLYMDEVRSLINILENRERILLTITNLEAGKKADYTIISFMILVILMVLLLFLIYYVIIGEFRRRKAVESDLRESSKRIHDLYNNAPCGYHSINPEGYFVEINNTELAWLGYERDEVINRLKMTDVLDEASSMIIRQLINNFRTGHLSEVKDTQLVFVRKDGSRFNGMINSTVMYNDHGIPYKTRTVLIDITDYKKAEERISMLNAELKTYNDQLLSANNELESFSYSVSHDLRAPLRAIDGYCKIIEEDYGDQLDEEGRRLLGIIIASSNRMSILIDDLLEFSRLGRKELTLFRVNVTMLINEVIQDLHPPSNVSITVNVPHTVLADKLMLKLVWQNLIDNAIKYSRTTEHPRIEIRSDEYEHEYIFSVKDNGAGFDMTYYNKLFNVFQRLHNNEEYEGSGVGLAIIQRIINRHSGRVWAESELNSGSTFYFSIPKNE